MALLSLVQEGWQTHGDTDFGRRVEQRWPYYFLCMRLASALLFLAVEGPDVEERRRDWTKILQPQHRWWGITSRIQIGILKCLM